MRAKEFIFCGLVPFCAAFVLIPGCDDHHHRGEDTAAGSPIVRSAVNDLGSAPEFRYTELDDGTAFVVIGHATTPHMMCVMIRRGASGTWEVVQGVGQVPAKVLLEKE